MIGSKFDFMGRRKVATIISGLLLLASVVSLSFSGLNLGLDFTGGSLVEVGSSKEIAPEEVRRYLTGAGFSNGTVQTFGSNTELLIRMPPQPSSAVDEAVIAQSQAQLGDDIFQALLAQYPDMVLRQSMSVLRWVMNLLTMVG